MALSEVYERRGDYRTAARMVQHMIYTYGQHEYEMPSLLLGERDTLMALSQGILDRGATYLTDSLYGAEAARAATLAKQMLALYFSALSPLRKDLSVRAGELGAQRLLALRAASRELAAELDREAAEVLTSQNPTEQVLRLWEFPGTMAAQKVLDDLLAACETRRRSADLSLEEAAELRKREWALADAARVAGLKLPEVARKRLLAPPDPGPPAPIQLPLRERSLSLEEERGPAWLVLERHGCMDLLPDCIFMGGRVKKKLDNKFLLYCVDLAGGGVRWKAQEKRGEQWFDEIRLGEKGAEPGFFETFVHDEVVVSHGMNDVVAFEAKDGSLRWRYTTPYGFEIKHSVMSGDLLILVGQSETIALYLGTRDPRGEVAWQVKEEGIPYSEPYFVGDRLVSLRKMPSNLTVRYRSTGKLIGRLALPDLTLFDEHPLIENGPRALPLAHDGSNLVVTDGWYYLMLDVDKLRIVWKRLIDQNDATRLPPMRFAMKGNYLAVVKQDYDVKTIYMIDSRSGEVLWKTDPKVPDSPQPLDTMLIVGEKLYGIRLHPGQGFYFAGVDCRTGRNLFPMNEQKGYAGRPEAALLPGLYGNVAVVRVRDRQDFELKAFDVENGTLVHTIRVQGTGDFGEHGRVSATVNNGKLVLLGQNDLKWAGNQ
ncbi:MAG: PQQ-like beta-propeller repeat protein [Kiritimatiellae bacterium]|nr:PQQ-like beta-propeller repeat protein [Kiritimatiellia bacterium]